MQSRQFTLARSALAAAVATVLTTGLVAPAAHADRGTPADRVAGASAAAPDSGAGRAAEASARSSLLRSIRSAPVAGEIGGPVVPVTSAEPIEITFDAPGAKRVMLPGGDRRPESPGGAFISVSAQVPASGLLLVNVDRDPSTGWSSPIIAVDGSGDAGRWVTGSTLVEADTHVIVRVTQPTSVVIRTIAWVGDENRVDVPAGGVGIAHRPHVAFSTDVAGRASSRLVESLASDSGTGVFLTGAGGIPAQSAQLVFARADIQPLGSGPGERLQALDPTGQWRTLAQLHGDGRQVHLVAVLVDDVGFVRLRTTGAARATFTTVGWVSRGQETVAPEDRGAVVPILGDTVAVGASEDGAQTWREAEVAGLPQDDQGVTAILTSQAIGRGRVTIDGGPPGEWATRQVDGVASGLAFVPDADAGLRVRATGDLQVHVRAVAYVLSSPPRSAASPRSGAAPAITIDDLGDAAAEQRRTGQFTLSGTVRGSNGIAEVRVSIPGVPQRPFALVDHAANRWSIALRLPPGRSTVSVQVTDLGGRTATLRRSLAMPAPEPDRVQVAPDTLALDRALKRRLIDIAPGYLEFSGTTAPPVIPGGVLTADPFGKAPDGLLRKVDTLRQVGPSRWRIYTSPAGLADAVVSGTLGRPQQASRSLRGAPLVASWDVTVPVDLGSDDLLGSAGADPDSIAVQAALQARLAITGRSTFAIGLSIRTKWLIIPVGVDVNYFEYAFANQVRLIADRVVVGVSDGAVVAVDRPLGAPFRFTIPIATGIALTGGFTPRYQMLLNGNLDLTGEASVRTNLSFVYDKARGGWQDVTDDWISEPRITADLTFDGNSSIGLGGMIDAGVNDTAGVQLEWMLGVIGVKGQATLRVRSGVADQPDAADVSCDGTNRNLEVFSTFTMQMSAFLERQSWPIVRLDPWRQVWYDC